MLPAMKVGALALIWRIPATFQVRRGMIVFFRRPNGETWLKRVIGLPGDRLLYRQTGQTRDFRINGLSVLRSQRAVGVELTWIQRDGRGRRLTDPDGAPLRRREAYQQYTETLPGGPSYKILHRPTGNPANVLRQVRVPSGNLFVLGDNRWRSFDSRFTRFGLVPRRAVLGLALCDISREELMEK